jgi:hypothetical protein
MAVYVKYQITACPLSLLKLNALLAVHANDAYSTVNDKSLM